MYSKITLTMFQTARKIAAALVLPMSKTRPAVNGAKVIEVKSMVRNIELIWASLLSFPL